MNHRRDSLVDRLRGIYKVPVNDGAGLLDGKDTFTQKFPVTSISREAADEIERLNKLAPLGQLFLDVVQAIKDAGVSSDTPQDECANAYIDAWRKMKAENMNLRRLAANALLMARHGDYSHCGEPEEAGRTAQCLANLDAEAAALGLVIGGTFYDNDQRYGITVDSGRQP